MTDRIQRVSLSEQIGALDRARLVVGGGARVSPRAVERDYEVQAIEAALRTLRWLRAHESEIRSAISPKGSNSAQAAVEACAAEQGGEALEKKPTPCEFPLARRAAMRCAEGAFQKFLGVDTAEGAADALRRRCEVASRKDFDRDRDARERWRGLEAEFSAWLRCAGEADGSAEP